MSGLSSRDSFVGHRKVVHHSKDGINKQSKNKLMTAMAILLVSTLIISAVVTVAPTHKNSSSYTRATATHVVINEVYYDAPSGYSEPQNEWIELYNPTSNNVDISGWNITDYEGNWSFPDGTTIPAGGYILIVNDATYDNQFSDLFPGVHVDFDTNTSNTVPDVAVSGSLSLANSGDDVHLLDADGNEVDVVWYGNGGDMGRTNAAPDVAAGHSIARLYNAEDTDNSSADFYDELSPTPRAQNTQSVPELGILAPMIAIILVALVVRRK